MSKTSYSWSYDDSGKTLSHSDNENNLKYLYDYDSLGRLIRQEIQNNSNSSHVGSTEVAYDVRNNVTKVASEFGGYTAKDEYMYSSNSGAIDAANSAKDNLISRYRIAGSRTVDYSYDSLNRLTQKKLTTTTPIYTNYTYKASDLGGKYTTTMVETEKLDNTTYKYYYDKVGNITSITKNSGAYRTYSYDKKNQLLSEVNNTTGVTTNFTYDAIGNITKKVQSSTSGTKTINYRYGNDGKTGWNNLLTGVDLSGNGAYESTETISYDAIGNPTTYLGASLSWYGRQLKSYTKGSTSVSYTYAADGLRGTKIHNGTKSTYHYVNGQLRYETRGNLKFYYFYDESGNLSAIRYYDEAGAAHAYFALTNTQGDVISLYNNNGAHVASYEYDAWGNCTITKDTDGVAELNPIRYRGYYYDSETKLYYLQSRFYDPAIGRFLNADGISNFKYYECVQDFSIFSYCRNQPINYYDYNGGFTCVAFEVALSTETAILPKSPTIPVPQIPEIIVPKCPTLPNSVLVDAVPISPTILTEREAYPIAKRCWGSKKEQYQSAKKAGKNKEPIHDPHGHPGNPRPHYHPNVKNSFSRTPKQASKHDHYYYSTPGVTNWVYGRSLVKQF